MQLRRGDAAVFSVSAGLTVIVAAAVAFSVLVLDRSGGSRANQPGTSSSSLLVVTWGPSLCQVAPSNAGCKDGHVDTLGRKLLLHGLWPQPATEQFCGMPRAVAHRARDLKDMRSLNLPADVQTKLQSMMSDVAVLAPHEWYAHGTCSGVTPAVYFRDAATLAEQAGKILNPVFETVGDRRLSLRTVRDRFDAEFGGGAGDRVGLTCRDVDGEEIVIYEVHLSLPPIVDFGATENTVSLRDLLVKGPTISAGCRRGRVP
ncbi:Ribonuclease I [Mycobacterium basiliense]|uniref:Ribonuclease I n=1 Tax=Mycobacterium basiliense TaxID=2094119 RepID=A0A447GGM1_9MYCO|nr:ribonuclease T(2) [Mycobacterium basiliense]VDM89568.1 Ribonuclease I [Mycobacterium basiliense]